MDVNVFAVLTEFDRSLPYYLVNAGEWNHQMEMLREEGYPDFQWLQCIEGTGELRVKGRTYTVQPGQGMLLYPNEAHHYYPKCERWSMRWVAFNGSQAAATLASFQLHQSQTLNISDPAYVLELMKSAIDTLHRESPIHTVDCSSLVYTLMVALYKYGSASDIRSRHHHFDRLTPVFHLIETHYHQLITLGMMAETLGVTEQHVCVLFQSALGLRPIEYVTKYRIRKAKELLLGDLNLEVKTVARLVGYEQPSYFIKLFRQQEGVTPNAFRSMHRRSS